MVQRRCLGLVYMLDRYTFMVFGVLRWAKSPRGEADVFLEFLNMQERPGQSLRYGLEVRQGVALAGSPGGEMLLLGT